MADPRLRRITKEIRDIESDNSSSIEISMLDENPFHLIGTFPGPENSPYEGGIFDVDIVVPEGYPFKPVVMKFITRVYHPNISSASGAICLDILKDQWSPVLTLKSTLLSLRSLLCSPEPNDPQDAEVAKVYLSDQAAFQRTAKYWTEIYANGSESARPPPKGGKQAEANGNAAPGSENGAAQAESAPDPIALAGLKKEHVEQFESMGFSQDQVIAVLKKLNYRGANVRNVTDEAVLNALLSG
ncbi:Ubiquitin-conjugating enzyme E2 1 [Tilletia horrida]|uniref:Ubiquitin-conjugating enzyme E2 1 n=1 Tax=Tilletia horrida TaxID=155126 RepID=A0AAN6JR69_9BASI|nr:Ubiquitin-conjugating enzyme E2 1 [Tilletia horrida]KAK0548754.1 Ubiquitin-conjugating enzyme E2 1 [Tilletia horrida]KAK0563859.1 Ubiquitin-conjugating enzyme E2 1 [Tilletia horrida]